MPKVKRNANLSRVARRQVAASENLPSPATRKNDTAEGDVMVNSQSSIPTASLDRKNANDAQKLKDTQQGSQKNSTVANDNNDEPDVPATQQLSRGQRKRQAKREQFLKKERMILSSLMLQRREDQKKRIDGLDAIKQALMDTASRGDKNASATDSMAEPQVQHVSTNKAKQKLVAKEVEHMNLILQHPAFKKDPFETMQEHLRNTLAEERRHQEIISKKRTEKEKQKRAEKEGIKKKPQKKKYKPRRTK
jgi:hypothetical protein